MTAFMQFQGPNFMMKVPTDWLITSTANVQAIFVAPQGGNGSVNKNYLQPNLIISMRRLKEGVTAEAIAEATKATQQQEYPEYEVLAEGKAAIEKVTEAVQRTYRWRKADVATAVLQQQTFVRVVQILFTLTATRPDIDQLARTDEIFNRMIQSFKVSEEEHTEQNSKPTEFSN